MLYFVRVVSCGGILFPVCQLYWGNAVEIHVPQNVYLVNYKLSSCGTSIKVAKPSDSYAVNIPRTFVARVDVD